MQDAMRSDTNSGRIARHLPVAQMDRAAHYGCAGRGFESSRAGTSQGHEKRPSIAMHGDRRGVWSLGPSVPASPQSPAPITG